MTLDHIALGLPLVFRSQHHFSLKFFCNVRTLIIKYQLILEYNGRWKMQHYYAKMFFNPILPSPYLNDKGDVVVEFISDSLEQVFKQMRVRVFKTDSMVPLIEVEKSVTAVS